ncbi:peptide chain release factor 1 [Candidatus Woesearchaeota archaeon CG10_big_fil_rev_8_21_14_0_10_44_13]|nr:MAG: peptide chain release factor 1 [Candidatus Woesearchaeota archaeon CG10_big_fil_rev_8_21_14_0_10_44_13]
MSTITAAQRFKLKKFVKELEQYRGRHTELVTVYVPAGYDMNKIIAHLYEEQGTASNIKSAATKNNVIGALERMIQHLRTIGRTPEHGLAVFSGNVAAREGQTDLRVWSLEPPIPLRFRLYRCDKEFVLDALRDMCEEKELYGLVVIDRRDANIAMLKGKTIVPVLETHSEVPGKTRAGGQSAHRFEMNRDLAAKAHFRKVAEYMKEQFLDKKDIKGIILGGPGPTKYDFLSEGQITDQVKKKIIAIKDLSYTGDFGLQELVDKSQDVLANEEITEEKELMGKFFDMLAKTPNKVSYGIAEVKKSLGMGAVEILLLSESLEDNAIEELEEIAKQYRTEVKIISTETREGVQLRELGKVAAILRYEVHS